MLTPCRAALLAGKGFDQSRLAEQLGRINELAPTALEPTTAVEETDLDGYLESRFEESVLGVVEALQARVLEESQRLVKQTKEANWERLKRLYLEKRQVLLSPTSSTAAMAGGATVVRRRAGAEGSKTAAAAQVVRRLNEARATASAFAPAAAFGDALRPLEPDALAAEHLADCWEGLAVIARESRAADGNIFVSGAQPALAGAYGRQDAEWQAALVGGSRSFLETMFSRYIDKTIATYPREAMLGGRPGIVDRVKAFANIRVKRMGQAEAERLETAPSPGGPVPHWLVLFGLVRAGCTGDALLYAQAMEPFIQRTEPCFVAYLKAFAAGGLAGSTLSQLRADYAQRTLGGPQDPYKLALLKLMGRCDLAKKSIPEVIQTSEDYLWLQLHLAAAGSEYELAGLQKTVLAYGPGHFDPKGTTPLRYFQVLLLVGLFEEAVAYLHETAFQADAVHFAVALVYHGLLRVAPDPAANLWEVATRDATTCAINFGALMGQWSKAVAAQLDQAQGLQYVFLLTLCPLPAYRAHCHDLVRAAVVESPDAAALLGDVRQDGTVLPGYLAKNARLLGLTDTAAFMAEITTKAAERCEREGRLEDALQLYNLAAEYTRVLQLLLKRLGRIVGGAFQPDDLGSAAAVTTAILQYYQAQDRIRTRIDPGLVEGCHVLLGLAELRRLVEEGSWAEAVQLLETSSVLAALFPLDDPSDSIAVTRAADRFRPPSAGGLPDAVSACLPESLLLVMQALHGRFQSLREHAYADPGRQAELDRTRRMARSAMLMVGLVRARIQPEVCAQLTRLDIMLN